MLVDTKNKIVLPLCKTLKTIVIMRNLNIKYRFIVKVILDNQLKNFKIIIT